MTHDSKIAYYARPEVVDSYYDFSFGGRSGRWVEEREAQAVLALVGSAASVLDLACGEGRLAARLAPPTWVVGCDTSLPMLAGARQRAVRHLVCGDAFALPFAPALFDCVACSRLFFHFADFGPILQQLRPVLKPGGTAVFDTFRWSPRSRVPLLTSGWDGRIFTASVRDVQRQVERAGWEVVARQGCFLFSPLVYRYLPFVAVQALALIEHAWPEGLLVKDYWKVRPRASGLA